jgi:hypothetical protein
MFDTQPTITQLSEVMVTATAPAFILGAIASFISLIIGRMNGIIERSRMISAIPVDSGDRAHLKADLPRLRKRSALLHKAIRFAVASAIVTIVLICLAFFTAFFGVRHEVGGALMFVIALSLFGISLSFLAREVSIGLSEVDHVG